MAVAIPRLRLPGRDGRRHRRARAVPRRRRRGGRRAEPEPGRGRTRSQWVALARPGRARRRSADVVEPVVGRPDPPPGCGRRRRRASGSTASRRGGLLLDAVPGHRAVDAPTGDRRPGRSPWTRRRQSVRLHRANDATTSPEADDAVDVLADAIRELVERRGQAAAPAFVHWGHVATGGDPDEVPVLTPPPRSSCSTRSPCSTTT